MLASCICNLGQGHCESLQLVPQTMLIGQAHRSTCLDEVMHKLDKAWAIFVFYTLAAAWSYHKSTITILIFTLDVLL